MSILLYDFKQLTQCISEVESIETKVNSKKKEWLTKKKEEEEEDASTRKTIRENLKNMVQLYYQETNMILYDTEG
jgi:hypothetical protein